MNNLQINEIKRMVKESLSTHAISTVEGSFVWAFIKGNNLELPKIKSEIITEAVEDYCEELAGKILNEFGSITIEMIADAFELLLEEQFKIENGVVFTPDYIVEYISKITLHNDVDEHMKIIDPACGTGIFLVGVAEYIHRIMGLNYRNIVENMLYGLDLHGENIYRTKLILSLLLLKNGDYGNAPEFNLLVADSLRADWNKIFCCEGFDYVVGNPPYVNPHEMNKETVLYLKGNFETTKSGVFNIFYAFVEHAYKYLKQHGKIGFIVPNNFLTIKSAEALRRFIMKNKCLEMLIDFDHNMLFKPIRTYNAILVITKTKKEHFHYFVMSKVNDVQCALRNIKMHSMPISRLDKRGWQLVDERAYSNIMKIESCLRPLKDYIRTGIATLRDGIYMLDLKDERGYYKELKGKKYYIEKALTRKLYKISDIKEFMDIERYQKAIIFPYKMVSGRYEIISEDEFKTKYPSTYAYLLEVKPILDGRDKGKPNKVAWYAYGRTQGLNKYGKKLLYPTFSKEPRFIMENDENSLFCNGYAIFANDYIELEILQKILNSKIMKYYIDNTSYSIEGGYRCYQKKYIENFTLPLFDQEELEFLRNQNDAEEINTFLISKYGIDIE